ncbi:homocysteine S-methyltransferase family protein [Bacillus licheniformis]|nr:homocysteine S-methyltransferase family protein [Bacillus licheniformis]
MNHRNRWRKIKAFAEEGWLNIVGGCCGTTPAHIEALADEVALLPPRTVPSGAKPHTVSGIDGLIYEETMRPLLSVSGPMSSAREIQAAHRRA